MIDDYTPPIATVNIAFILSGNYLSAADRYTRRVLICRRGERLFISLGSVEPIRDKGS